MFEYISPDGTALPENEVIKLAKASFIDVETYAKKNKLTIRSKQKKKPEVKQEAAKPIAKKEVVKEDVAINKPIYLRKAEEAVELSTAENIAKEKAKGKSIYYTPEAKKAKVDIELAKGGYFTENDLNSSEELVEKLKKNNLSSKGLLIEQTGIGNDNITLRGAGGEKLGVSADQQFAMDLPAVKVGSDLSKEERKQNADILNKYISDYGDNEYIVKSKAKYGSLYKSIWDKTKTEAPTQDQRLKKYLQKQEEDYKQALTFGTGPKFSDPTEKRMAGLASKDVTPKLTSDQKYRAETGKWPMPSQATVNKWWDNKEKETREAKLNGAIGDLPMAERTAISAINQDRKLSENKSTEELSTERNELNKVVSDFTKRAKIFNENPTSVKEFNQLKKEEQQLFTLRDEFNKKVQTQKSNYDRIATITDTALDDYDRLSQTGTLLKNTGLSIVTGAADLLATGASAQVAAVESLSTDKTFSKSYKETKDLLKETFLDPIYSQKKDVKDELELYQKDLNIDQIESVKDFGRWAMGVTTQMPSSLSMAMAGPAAMPLFFLSSYGEKSYELVQNKTDAALGLLEIQEMIKNGEVDGNDPEIAKEVSAYKKTLDLSEGQEFTSKMIAGIAEAGFERLGSIGILKRTADALRAIPKSSIKQASKALGGQIALSIPVEGATETLTQLSNNIGDIHVLGENKNMFEGVPDAAAAGAFMGPGFAIGGAYKGMRTAIASEVVTRAELKQRAGKVKELEKMLGLSNLAMSDITKAQVNGLDVDPRLKEAANEIIGQLEKEDLKVLQRLEGMNGSDIQAVGDINQQLRKVRQDWQDASMDGGLNFVQLEGLKDYYQGKWKSLQEQRETILNKGVTAEGGEIPIKQLDFENLAGSGILSNRQTKNTYLNAIANFKNLSKLEKDEYLEEAKNKKGYKEESKDSFAAEVYADKQIEKLLDANIEASNTMLGEGNGIITVRNIEELQDKEPGIWQMLETDRIAREKNGEITEDYTNTNGFKTPDGRTVILKDNAIKNRHASTGSHEALHVFTDKAITSPSGQKAMKDLQKYLEEKQPNFWLTVKERLKAYEEGDIADGQELMQAISDSYLDGTKVDRSTFNNIAIAINKASKGKLFPSANNANFSLIKPDTGGITPSGKALFDTVINYSRRAKGDAVNAKGVSKIRVILPEDEDRTEELLQRNFGADRTSRVSFSKSKVDELKEELAALEEEYDEGYGDMEEGDYKNAKSNLETKIKAEIKLAAKVEPTTVVEKPKKEVSEESSVKEIIKENKGKISSDKVQEIYDKKGTEGALEIIKLFKPITARIVDKRRDAPGFSEPDLTYEIENGKGGILELIMKYNPEEGVPLAAYINKYLPVRAITASRRILDKEFTSDVSEEVNVKATETADQNMTERVVEKPTYKNALESKVFTPDVLETVNSKILPIVRTLKSRIDAPITLNRTVTPLIGEIRDEIGKQLDIDIKTMLGGKKDGVLRKELLRTKRYILENMTTTWLMGKDGQGGIPQAIQKRIDGKWVSFPNWVGQKIDREAMSTDLAGRTSGAELVRRLPNVFNNVSDEDFLAQIIGPDGNPIRGRKESVSKAMAEESAMDIINADLINEGPIYEALKTNQERLGVEIKEAFVQEYLKQSERGNIKRSLSKRQLIGALKALEAANWEPKSESFIKYANNLPEKVQEGINEMLFLQKNMKALGKRLKAITLENAGAIFEKQMLASAIIAVKDFKSEIGKFEVLTKKAAGSNSTVVDLQIRFKYKNKSKKPIVFNIELKADKNAQISSFTINNITSEKDIKIGNRSTPLTAEGQIKQAIANNQGVKDYVEYFLNNGGSFTSRGNIRVPIKTFYEAQGADKTGDVNLQAKANTLIKDLTVDTIVELNKRKANPNDIIILGNSGAFVYEENAIAGFPSISDGENENKEKSFQIMIRPVRGKETNGMTTVSFRAFPGISSKWNKQSTVSVENGAANLLKAFEAHAKINFSKSISNSQEAVGLSLTSFSKTPKGISVFDFDDTVGLTKGSVLYTMPDGSEGKLNAEEFAKEGSSFLEQGAVFDFSEFSKVVGGKPGPMVTKMKKMIGKFGPENFFILTARPANAAGPIHEFLSSIGIDIPLENITGLGNSTAQAKADWMTGKAAEGYNDFYFSDDAIQNVKAVKDALDVLDVKSKIQQAKLKFSKTLNSRFNDILQENVGLDPKETFSDILAKRKGTAIGKYRFFVPPSAADFELLLYDFLGRGKVGEKQYKFFTKALLEPYSNGIALIDAAKQSIKNDYLALKKAFPDVNKNLGKLTPDGNFTYDQALRVSMWNSMGVEIPGLDKSDITSMVNFVNNDASLSAFKAGLIATGRQGTGWIEPSEYWDAETIISDLHNITEKVGRKKYLTEFIDNSKEIFTPENLNRIEVIYGSNFREALEDSIYRMTNGTNRESGTNRLNAAWLNWINNSTAAIMFFNTKSAILQTVGAINYLNWRENNPLNAALAFANQPQYWKDFAMIFNSDKIKERRSGLKEDVTSAEIANAAEGSKNKASAVISYLLKKGFMPTQIADSFAIAMGGASFYRNKVNAYLKQGMEPDEAEAQAWKDFSKVTDETQQSGDPRDISQQQASVAGRLVLAFQNTPMQQARLIKKSALDLINGRGDAKTHISKIVYYTAVQNIIFGSLQSALFTLLFDDDDEEDKKKKTAKDKWIEIGNGTVDTLLRGSGLGGAIVATLKNVAKRYLEEKEKGFKADYGKVLIEAANIAPPIGSKFQKAFGAMRTAEFEKDVIKERGWSVTQDGKLNLSPAYSVLGQAVEAGTNLPVNRLVTKVNNVSEALDSRNKSWQRIALALGYKPYAVGAKNEEADIIKAEAKTFRKEGGKIKAKETRAMTRDSLNKLSPEDFKAYVLKKKTERLAVKDSINKLPKAKLDKYLKEKEASKLFTEKQKEVLEEIKRDSINNLSTTEYFKYLEAVENKKEIAKINRELEKFKKEQKRNIYK